MSFRGQPKQQEFETPCALCEKAEGVWLMFGGRKFCDECCDAWRQSDRWPEDRKQGAFAPVFEAWFREMKARAA